MNRIVSRPSEIFLASLEEYFYLQIAKYAVRPCL